jgi:hypothetical protein
MSMSRVLRTGLTAMVVAATMMTVASSAVVATSVPPAPSTAYEGPGSASAEEAVSTYMNGLAAGDADAMVSSFAIETFAEHFDLRAYLEWIGAYTLGATPILVPAETPFAAALGVEQRHGNVINQILFQYLGLIAPDVDPSLTVNVTDDTTLDEFYGDLDTAVTALDTSEIESFTFVPRAEVDPAAAEAYESEQNQANLDRRRGIFGADEISDVVVRFAVGGREFFAFFSVIRYGDAWWIDQLGGNFAQLLAIPALKVGAAPTDLDINS